MGCPLMGHLELKTRSAHDLSNLRNWCQKQEASALHLEPGCNFRRRSTFPAGFKGHQTQQGSQKDFLVYWSVLEKPAIPLEGSCNCPTNSSLLEKAWGAMAKMTQSWKSEGLWVRPAFKTAFICSFQLWRRPFFFPSISLKSTRIVYSSSRRMNVLDRITSHY